MVCMKYATFIAGKASTLKTATVSLLAPQACKEQFSWFGAGIVVATSYYYLFFPPDNVLYAIQFYIDRTSSIDSTTLRSIFCCRTLRQRISLFPILKSPLYLFLPWQTLLLPHSSSVLLTPDRKPGNAILPFCTQKGRMDPLSRYWRKYTRTTNTVSGFRNSQAVFPWF